ncbi:TetR family transcriptional regulator [Mycobacterium sp. ML4]
MSEPAPAIGVKAAQSAQTRKRLIDAASELFAEQGYAGTSILHIAERSGISRGSVAWHFGSKDGLLWAVVEEAFAQWETTVLVPDVGDAIGLDAVRAALRSHRRFLEGDTARLRLFYVLMFDAIGPRDDLRVRFAQLHTHLRNLCEKWIAAGQKAGEIRADADPRAVVTVLIGAVGGIAYQRLIDPELDLDPLYRSLDELAMDGLRAR